MRIGGRDVVFNESFLATKDELVEFDILVAGQKLPIEITFVEGKDADPVSWTVVQGTLKMTFSGLAKRGALMSSLSKPYKIGVINGITFGFNFACSVSGNIYQVHFIVMSGGEYDE
ncbi:hypothetical protein LA374_17260 [Aeromonas schubertii]|uniref:Uncharacterized protein n=1 Tax=Aeromonas schubertii TaxID=652 RepID=A0ABS7VEY0_9GAMM|nr:hypothetical protein [Aeromonas schubertii]MBZ6067943.1 hypothetical protein [Aeromonas schubertii]